MPMKSLLMYGLIGGAIYWLVTQRKVTPPVTAVATTGAPQPQAVSGNEEPIVDVYDLAAFPMGSFADRR